MKFLVFFVLIATVVCSLKLSGAEPQAKNVRHAVTELTELVKLRKKGFEGKLSQAEIDQIGISMIYFSQFIKDHPDEIEISTSIKEFYKLIESRIGDLKTSPGIMFPHELAKIIEFYGPRVSDELRTTSDQPSLPTQRKLSHLVYLCSEVFESDKADSQENPK